MRASACNERRMKRGIPLAGITLLLTSTALAMGATQEPPELPSVLVVTKSDNRNELHYGAVVDPTCMPMTAAPLQPYWLMREHGPHVTEPLARRELGLLGVAHQEVDRDQIRFGVNAMPGRTFVAHLSRGADGTCASRVDSTIAGTPARVESVYAKLRFLGVEYVQLTGRTDDGRVVQERVHP